MQFLKRLYRRQSAKLMYRRGIACKQKQSHERAVDAFSDVVALDDCCWAEAVVQRGVSRMNLNDCEGAIADFDSIIQAKQIAKNPYGLALAQAYFYRGQLYRQSGDETAALQDWAKAISHRASYSLPYFHRALLLLNTGNSDRAFADLNAAIKAYPILSSAYFQRGKLRLQRGDKPGAIDDLTCAIANDFTLEEAKETLAYLQRDAYDAYLSQVLAAPLAKKGLSVEVCYRCDRLDISVHRAAGTGVNYYTLPTLIRQHLVPLLLDEVTHFRLIGRAGEATRPDWNQSYRLYKDQPCPPSCWRAAVVALLMCPPLAVPAFIKAAKVKSAHQKGNYVEAVSASRSVKVLSIASSIPFAFFLLLSLSFVSYDFSKGTPTFSAVEQFEIANWLERKIEKR